MTELFPNVSQEVRDAARFWVETSLATEDPYEGVKQIMKFKQSLPTEEEQNFVDFYFNMVIEGLKGVKDERHN